MRSRTEIARAYYEQTKTAQLKTLHACDFLQAPPLASSPHVWAVSLPPMQKAGAASLLGGRHPRNTPSCPELAVPLAVKSSICQDYILGNQEAPEFLHIPSPHHVHKPLASSRGNLSGCRHGHAHVGEAFAVDDLVRLFAPAAPKLLQDHADRRKPHNLRTAWPPHHLPFAKHPAAGVSRPCQRHAPSLAKKRDWTVAGCVACTEGTCPRLNGALNASHNIRMRSQFALPLAGPCSSHVALELACTEGIVTFEVVFDIILHNPILENGAENVC